MHFVERHRSRHSRVLTRPGRAAGAVKAAADATAANAAAERSIVAVDRRNKLSM